MSDQERRWGFSQLLGDITQDVRFALRTQQKHPGFAVAVIATLAIGNLGHDVHVRSRQRSPQEQQW